MFGRIAADHDLHQPAGGRNSGAGSPASVGKTGRWQTLIRAMDSDSVTARVRVVNGLPTVHVLAADHQMREKGEGKGPGRRGQEKGKGEGKRAREAGRGGQRSQG